jgi:PPOX class probable F420-dependent enzyme
MTITLDQAFDFVRRHDRGVLVTLRRDGRPQLSNIIYVAGAESDAAAARAHSVRISVTESRAKTKNLRRDPRASLHVTRDDFFAYAVLDGTVELSPPATAPDDAVVAELVEMYRLMRGEHPDWNEYAESMVAEQRVVATLTATSAYGMLD